MGGGRRGSAWCGRTTRTSSEGTREVGRQAARGRGRAGSTRPGAAEPVRDGRGNSDGRLVPRGRDGVLAHRDGVQRGKFVECCALPREGTGRATRHARSGRPSHPRGGHPGNLAADAKDPPNRGTVARASSLRTSRRRGPPSPFHDARPTAASAAHRSLALTLGVAACADARPAARGRGTAGQLRRAPPTTRPHAPADFCARSSRTLGGRRTIRLRERG